MSKILSQSGDSLADVYDVEGSIIGVEELQAKDVNLVHEMGSTILSERLGARILQLPTGAIAQNTDWAVNFSVGSRITRILGVQVVTLPDSRLVRCQVSVTEPPALGNTDFPIWYWDGIAGDISQEITILLNGSTVTQHVLVPTLGAQLTPNLALGAGQRLSTQTISFRGRSFSFGAGTVSTTALVYVAFPQLGGVSSRGLPIPGW